MSAQETGFLLTGGLFGGRGLDHGPGNGELPGKGLGQLSEKGGRCECAWGEGVLGLPCLPIMILNGAAEDGISSGR